jgi:hypothetical protein
MTDPSKEFFDEFENNLVKGITPVEEKKIIPDDNEEITFESQKINVSVSEPMRLLLIQMRRTLLLNNLRSHQVFMKIKDQGIKDGLPIEQIRDIVIAAIKDIRGELGPRQIRRLLPQESKHQEMMRDPKSAVTEAANEENYLPNDCKEMLERCRHLLRNYPQEIIKSFIEALQELKSSAEVDVGDEEEVL